MDLKHVLLGLLAYEPSTGYSLHRKFFNPRQPSISNIYRALSLMNDEGLVKFKRVAQNYLPTKKVYSITEAGRVELDKWLANHWPMGPIYEPFVESLWFASLTDNEHTIANMKSYIEARKHEYQYYYFDSERLVDRALKRWGSRRDKFYWDLAMDYIRKRADLELEWAEGALQHLMKLKPKAASKTGKARKRSKSKVKSVRL